MWRSRLSIACYAGSALLLLLCAALARPADLVQFVFGGIGPPLLHVQLWILAGAVGLLATGAYLGRVAETTHRETVAGLGAFALCIAALIAWRELGAYSRETVQVNAGQYFLEGTLYVPRGSTAPRSAILIVPGSGPVRRSAYHLFADRLARAGHIVFSVDKRGIGGSSGRYQGDDIGGGAALDARVVDAAAAMRWLRSDSRVDSTAVGVFAVSQGGWVVPKLTQRESGLRFAIVMSGPAVSSGEEEEFSKLTDEHADHFGRKPPPLPFPEIDRRMRSVEPSGYDPRSDLSRLGIPTLWLFGDWDNSIPVDGSVRVLDSVQALGSPITIRRFVEANHGLMIARGPNGRALSRFAPGVWDTVASWIARRP